VQMSIADPEARMLHYVNDFFKRLNSVGYGAFKKENPKKTVELLCKNLFPQQLRDAMKERVEYDVTLEKDVKKFVQRTCEEAKACQTYGQRTRTPRPSPRVTNDSEASTSTAPTRPAPTSKEPVCWWPPHAAKGIRHKLVNCTVCPEDEKKKIFEERRRKREGERPRNVKRLNKDAPPDDAESSIIFTCTYAHRTRDVVTADIGSEVNLMDETLLERIVRDGGDVVIKDLREPRTFSMAVTTANDADVNVKCKKMATMPIELHIRHGKTLVLRNVQWMVTDQGCAESLLSRPVLERIGLVARDVIERAADRLGGEVDVAELGGGIGRISRIMEEGVFHSNGGVDERDVDVEDWLDFGEDEPEEKERALTKAVDVATENGISTDGRQTLATMLEEFSDVLRIRLGRGLPADVEPMVIELRENVRPVRVSQRRYPPAKRQFLERVTDKLLELGFLRTSKKTEWVAAPLVVPKAPPANFRLTIDLRPVNAATIPMTWPMPNIEAELGDLRTSRYFISIDFVSGYWQLPLAETSQQLHTFVTTKVCVMPTRTLQGGRNSGANFQSRVEPCFSAQRHALKAWLDDFALHAPTEEQLLRELQTFLTTCRNKNLKVSLPKSTFFSTTLKWCGRIIDADGVRLDPRRLAGLANVEKPETGAELCEYVHCLTWMANAIPDFTERVAPLRTLLEEAHRRSGSRTKRSVQKYTVVSLGWGHEHEVAFESLQDQLHTSVKLAHRDPDKELCIYTDASERYWAGVVTQCERRELEKNVMEQRHEPLAFLSGEFSGPELAWTTYEKEGYAIHQTFRRMDYMLLCEEPRVFTDHRNLLFCYSPTTLDPTLGRHKVMKVLRWAVYLSQFQYRIEHVDGEANVMADVMTRWMRGYRGKRCAIRRVTYRILENAVVPSPESKDFEWPNFSQIRQAQEDHVDQRPKNAERKGESLWSVNGRTWIPDEADDLQLRLLVVAHCGVGGHRGAESTESTLREEFTWSTLKEDVRDFVADCIHCMMAKTGHKIPRPFAETLHAEKPNDVVHFDFLYMGPSNVDVKYVLVIKDDLSGYVWLRKAAAPDSGTTSTEIASWIRTFGAMNVWVSDQGSHFKNNVMETLALQHRIRHRFTVAYSPWANGTVENVNKHVLAACRALATELRLAPQDWPDVIGLIQTVLNEAPLPRLGKREDGTLRCPLEVMTGICPRRVLVLGVDPAPDNVECYSLERVRAEQVARIDKLQTSLLEMHKDVAHHVGKNRQRQLRSHNKKTNVVQPNFHVGDFVLVRRAQDRGHKLNFRWIGPRRITNVVSELVYDVTKLDGSGTERVHAARLKTYRARAENEYVSPTLLELAERTESRYEIVERIHDVGEDKDGMFLNVEWAGLPDRRDWTWNPLGEMYEDVPQLVTDFLRNVRGRKRLVTKAKELLTLKP